MIALDSHRLTLFFFPSLQSDISGQIKTNSIKYRKLMELKQKLIVFSSYYFNI